MKTRQKEQQTMKPQQKRLAVFALMGLVTMPALGQMAGMPGKSNPAKATTQKGAAQKPMMCCMGGMQMDKKTSPPSATEKKKMGQCCRIGMKAKEMKPGGMGMGMMGDMDKMMSGMSPMDKSEMKKMMEKMMAMPPAERKKAMQKMSGQPMDDKMDGMEKKK